MNTHIRICAIDVQALVLGLRHHGLIVSDEPVVVDEFYDVAVEGPLAPIELALEALLVSRPLITQRSGGALFVRPPVA